MAASARHDRQTKNALERQRLLGWYSAIQTDCCATFQMQICGYNHTELCQAHAVASLGIFVPCPAARVTLILLPG